MEGGRRRSPYTITFDELIGRTKTEPCSCGFTVYPPTTTVLEKDTSRVDSTLNNQRRSQMENSQSQSAEADGKSPSKQQTTESKDDKLLSPYEQEVGYFSSSIHYGGREFYVTSSSNQLFGTAKDKRTDELDDLDSDIIGPRGEWWQGSYHY